MLRPLLIAIQFLTRLPLPRTVLKESDYQAGQLGRSVLFYPVAGLLIGAILYLSMYGIAQLSSPVSPLLSAAIILVLWVLLTGALHLDGLSDSADAWVGGYGDRDKTLAIMKDPYCGPAGVAIVVICLLLKFAILSQVVTTNGLALIMSPLFARAAIILLFLTTPYVRKQGLGSSQTEHLPRKPAWLILCLLVAIAIYILQMPSAWLLLSLIAVFLLLRALMMHRLGGTTGDTAGAMVEIIEIQVLLALVV